MIRVLLIGQHTQEIPPQVDGLAIDAQDVAGLDLDAVNTNLAGSTGFYTHVFLCPSVNAAKEILGSITNDGKTIDLLDLCDHGAAGGMLLGEDVAFHVDDGKLVRGREFAQWLAPRLSATGQLRLLGCNTAVEERGRLLLRLLDDVMNWDEHRVQFTDRIVFGTIRRIGAAHLDHDRGFVLRRESLYSSLAALDFVPPVIGIREQSNNDWLIAVQQAAQDEEENDDDQQQTEEQPEQAQ
jgi:hypothetical protein